MERPPPSKRNSLSPLSCLDNQAGKIRCRDVHSNSRPGKGFIGLADVATDPLHRDFLVGAVGLHVVEGLVDRILQFGISLAQSNADIVGALKLGGVELANLFAAFLDSDQDRNIIRSNGVYTARAKLEQQFRNALIGADRPAALLARALVAGFATRHGVAFD